MVPLAEKAQNDVTAKTLLVLASLVDDRCLRSIRVQLLLKEKDRLPVGKTQVKNRSTFMLITYFDT